MIIYLYTVLYYLGFRYIIIVQSTRNHHTDVHESQKIHLVENKPLLSTLICANALMWAAVTSVSSLLYFSLLTFLKSKA